MTATWAWPHKRSAPRLRMLRAGSSLVSQQMLFRMAATSVTATTATYITTTARQTSARVPPLSNVFARRINTYIRSGQSHHYDTRHRVVGSNAQTLSNGHAFRTRFHHFISLHYHCTITVPSLHHPCRVQYASRCARVPQHVPHASIASRRALLPSGVILV